jgi:hypothetical protein
MFGLILYLYCWEILDGSLPNEIEVKDTIDTKKSASYIDCYIEIDNWWQS